MTRAIPSGYPNQRGFRNILNGGNKMPLHPGGWKKLDIPPALASILL